MRASTREWRGLQRWPWAGPLARTAFKGVGEAVRVATLTAHHHNLPEGRRRRLSPRHRTPLRRHCRRSSIRGRFPLVRGVEAAAIHRHVEDLHTREAECHGTDQIIRAQVQKQSLK
jgi:hypothetical protein